MSSASKSDTTKDSKSATWKAELQSTADIETEQGYRGTAVDPTPNEHYTVAGVLAGKPTPETDMDHRAGVQKALKVREPKPVGRHHKNVNTTKEDAQGYRGVAVDQTPNENYTIAGVIAGKPTPETYLEESGFTTRGKTLQEVTKGDK